MPKPITSITIEGRQLPLSQFSPEVQSAVSLAASLQSALRKAEFKAIQAKLAYEHVSTQLNQRIAEELKGQTITVDTNN